MIKDIEVIDVDKVKGTAETEVVYTKEQLLSMKEACEQRLVDINALLDALS